MQTLLDLLEESAARFGDRNALGLRRDDGTVLCWSQRELVRRSRLAAWRLRALGLQPGDPGVPPLTTQGATLPRDQQEALQEGPPEGMDLADAGLHGDGFGGGHLALFGNDLDADAPGFPFADEAADAIGAIGGDGLQAPTIGGRDRNGYPCAHGTDSHAPPDNGIPTRTLLSRAIH